MIDIINIFLTIFSAVSQLFSGLAVGGYTYGSMIFGGFAIGVVLIWVLRVIKRR